MNKPIRFDIDYTLENERVLLRPLHGTDLDKLLCFSENEPELWKYSLMSAAGKDALQKYIQTALDGKSQQKEYPFIVFDKLKNQFAGCTRFYDIQVTNQTVQLGYTWYGKAFQGTGLNLHCKYLLLQLAFDEWNMERVEFRADNDNNRSIAAMKKIGCKIEGVLRSNSPKPNGAGRRDSIVLSILKGEWREKVNSHLQKLIAD